MVGNQARTPKIGPAGELALPVGRPVSIKAKFQARFVALKEALKEAHAELARRLPLSL